LLTDKNSQTNKQRQKHNLLGRGNNGEENNKNNNNDDDDDNNNRYYTNKW